MISLIATVLNEGDNIHHLFNSILAQTRLPDEIVIVDGGSIDDTLATMESYRDQLPLRLLQQPGCNISQGRNQAIRAAQGAIIAVTDAGVRLNETWLEKITAPLFQDSDLDVVAGFFHADPQTSFEMALGATTLPAAREIDPASFLPSSRSIAFRKSAAEETGLYPEWLDYCEDLIFDLRLKAQGANFAFVPDAKVYFRPRSSLRKYLRQYYLYARGDGKANLWLKRHLIRYATYLILMPMIFLLGAIHSPLWWICFILGGSIYLYQPYRRLPALLRSTSENSLLTWFYCILAIPVFRLLGDLAKMSGYPPGRLWRLLHRPPDWRS